MKIQRFVILVFIALIISINSKIYSQSFSIGHTTINFIVSSRNNRSVPTEIYYPANASGIDVPIVSSNVTKFPVLVFGHGFLMTFDAYQNIWESLVPNGYILALPKTEGGFSPSHLEYAKDLSFVINQITLLGVNSASIFFDRISPMNSVMGHSMGGGAAFLAAQLNPNIKTIATLAAAETNPSAITAASNCSIPSLVFAGSNDCVTPPISNQFAMYNSIISPCKSYISITGGSHCQMANSNFYCSIGESSCTPSPTITSSFQHNVLNDYLLKWLQFQLKNDCVSGSQFDTLINSDNRISYQKNCSQCDILATVDTNKNIEIKIYPNPFVDSLLFSIDSDEVFNIVIFDSMMRKIISKNIKKNDSIDTSFLSIGIYFYEIKIENNTLKRGSILKSN